MKITEKMLLDGYQSITNGGDYVSMVNVQRICWNYRIFEDGKPGCVCEIKNKEVITLENDRYGVIDIDNDNETHAAIVTMQSDYEKWCGVEV